MAVFVGGIVAAVIGFILLLVWWKPFLSLLAGALPIMLLFGGAIAAYLGYDEVKDKLNVGDQVEGVRLAHQRLDEVGDGGLRARPPAFRGGTAGAA